jgi:hypothetical protein
LGLRSRLPITRAEREDIERTAVKMLAAGVSFPVASIDVLIRMKTGTARAQDASDVDALRRVQEATRGT